jgi:hypothetical protein
VVDAPLGEFPTRRQPGLAGADDHDVQPIAHRGPSLSAGHVLSRSEAARRSADEHASLVPWRAGPYGVRRWFRGSVEGLPSLPEQLLIHDEVIPAFRRAP